MTRGEIYTGCGKSHCRQPLGRWFPDQGRVPHISLVFREMWDSTRLTAKCLGRIESQREKCNRIPNLAKNERDPRISCTWHQSTSGFAVFIKESPLKCINAHKSFGLQRGDCVNGRGPLRDDSIADLCQHYMEELGDADVGKTHLSFLLW